LISVPESILSLMVLEANDRFPSETGGILLGRWVEAERAIITQIIGPGPHAKHRRASFEPDYEFQEAEIAKAHASADLGCEYLGDWHSHPRGPLSPSSTDMRVLHKIASYPAARCKDPTMCIISGGPYWAASAWRLVDGRCLEIDVAVVPAEGAHATTDPLSSRKVRLVGNVWRPSL
jgi:integrative and conjugative element protein (TIGR02256 family)